MSYLIRLLAIIKKDFKILLRSKSSGLIMIFGPLLIILLLGFAFNSSSMYDINVGTYSDSYSELSNNLIEQLEKSYDVKKIDLKDACINQVKRGNIHVCLVFPADMKVNNEGSNNIEFYVDHTRINLAYIVMDSISEELESKSSELSMEMTKRIVESLNTAKKELEGKQSAINNAISSTGDIISNIESSSSQLENLDINYSTSDLNLTELDKELKKKEEEYNETFTDLRDAIDSFESSVETIISKFEIVKNKRASIISNLESLKSSAQEDKTNLEGIQSSVNKVVENINSIEVTKPESIVAPFSTSVKPVTAEEKTHLGKMFPSLIALVIMLIAVLLSSTLVIKEKINKAYFRNFISPTGDFTFLLASFITNFLIILVQLIIIVGVSFYFFKEELLNVLLNSGIVLLLIAAVFVSLGMFLGYIFKTEETTTLGSLFVASILLFFSNTILPLESLPENIKMITLFNPFVVSQEVLRELMLFNLSLGDVLNYIGILGAFLVGFFILTFIMRELTKRRQY